MSIEGELLFEDGKAVFDAKDPGFLWRGKAKDYLRDKLSLVRRRSRPLRGAARWRLGELTGGDEGAAGVEAAKRWMRAESIDRSARMVRMLAPGFGTWRSAGIAGRAASLAGGEGEDQAHAAPAASRVTAAARARRR